MTTMATKTTKTTKTTRSAHLAAGLLCIPGLLGAPALSAQDAGPLGAPVARSAEGFTTIFDVAEMADGRVLLTDSRERTIAVVDMAGGGVERIGRRGEGPREYMSVFTILPTPDGSFRVTDSNLRRFTLVSEAGEVTGSEPIAWPSLPSFSPPRGPDRQGNVYMDIRDVGSDGLERGAVLYRWHVDSGRLDSVATVMNFAEGQGGRGLVPMPRGDAWSFLPDGSVARIVADDYHVEWIGGDGGPVGGPPVPHRRVRVGQEERDAWIEALYAGPPAGASSTGGGGGGSSGDESRTRRRQLPADRFPEFVPPFDRDYAPAAPRGEIWLRLAVESSQERTVFDILGRAGRRVRQLWVEGQARVVGFGEEAVFLARKDALDVEWLEKYAYPTGG